jgi:hypothetical protein
VAKTHRNVLVVREAMITSYLKKAPSACWRMLQTELLHKAGKMESQLPLPLPVSLPNDLFEHPALQTGRLGRRPIWHSQDRRIDTFWRVVLVMKF